MVQVAAGVLEEEGEEERGGEGAGEVEGRGDGKAFLFFLVASQPGAVSGHRVWLGLPHDEQLVGQLAWLRRHLVCELLLPVWPPVCLLAAAVWLCLSQLAGSSQLAISC
mgnify:CR=1 FL=1